jgi:ABC-2 type transport system ATP-binding protein
VFEIEVEEEAAGLVRALESRPWVIKIEQTTRNKMPVLRVQVKDVAAAKKELPGIVAASGLSLLRYELVMPSLEDIFMELVGGAS